MSACDHTNLPAWLNRRAAGLQLHPTSLPNQYGIGNLGRSAYEWIDFLNEAGFSYWQTCPVGPTGFGDSPYQVFCSSAGNPYFIDWEPLLELGYARPDDLDADRALQDESREVRGGGPHRARHRPALRGR